MQTGLMAEYESSFASVRSMERWRQPVFSHHTIYDFGRVQAIPNGIHTVYDAGLPIDLYVDLKPGKPLVIFLNGATVRSEAVKLPVFSGFGVVSTEGVSRLCVNDPTLYLDETLPLGWYAGSESQRLQRLLMDVFRTVIHFASPLRVMFVGGSGGGFASMYYSRLLPDSLAVVWNPQTDIVRYAPAFVEHYARTAFGIAGKEEAKSGLPNLLETDLCRLYASGAKNFVLYLQNASDWHVKGHCRPFLEALGHSPAEPISSQRLSDRLHLHMGQWGDGHIQPPKEFLSSLLGELLTSGEWSEVFRNGALPRMLDRADAASQIATA